MARLKIKSPLLCILMSYTILHAMEIPKPILNNGQKLLNAVKARDVEEVENILSCTLLRFHAVAHAYAWALYQAKELTPNETMRTNLFMQEAVEKVRIQRTIALDRLLVFDKLDQRESRVKQIDETLIDQGNMYQACTEKIYPYLKSLISEDDKSPTILSFYIGSLGDLDLLQNCIAPYEKNIDWNFCDKYGRTLLHMHAKEGNLTMVDYLLQKGTDFNRQTYYYEKIDEEDEKEDIFMNKTALHYAAEHHHIDIVKRLLNAGSNCNIPDHSGRIPLHYVAPGSNGNEKIFEMLILFGANIDATNNNKTLLWEAIEEDRPDTIKYLLKLGANPNKSLPTRISSINKEIFEILLMLDADIDTPHFGNKTLLYKAVEERDLNTIEYLLKLGADPDKEFESRFSYHTMQFCTDSPLELAYRQAYIASARPEEDYEEKTENIYRLLQKYRKNLSLETSSENS